MDHRRAIPEPELAEQGQALVTPSSAPPAPPIQCQRPGCPNLFSATQAHARFCSADCRVNNHRKWKRAERPAPSTANPAGRLQNIEAPLKLAPKHPDAIPGDGLRCLSCGEFIHALDGGRTRHIQCERTRMRALHKSATCRRVGCLNCNFAGLSGFEATGDED